MNCPLCNSETEKHLENFPGYRAGTFYDIYHCANCNTSFCSPMIVDSSIYDVIYINKDIIPGYYRYQMFAENIRNSNNPLDFLAKWEDVYYFIKQYFETRTTKDIKILEIGSGLGYLTYALSKSGYNVKGLEISDIAVENAKKRFGDQYICYDLYKYAKESDEKYDVIIMTELLEHIEDIYGFLNAARELLSDKGEILLTTPNKDFYPATYRWQTEAPPIHLWWLSKKSMRAIAGKLKMDLEIFDFTKYNEKHYPIMYGSDLSVNPDNNMIGQNGEILKSNNETMTGFRVFLYNTGILHVIRYVYAKLRYLFEKVPDQRSVLCVVLKR